MTLNDTNKNAVTGENTALTSTSVTVPNATLKSSGWTDNGNGSYKAIYTTDTASTNNKASLKLAGWSTDSSSKVYAITTPAILKEVSVNGHTFAKDAKFPTTGFKGGGIHAKTRWW